MSFLDVAAQFWSEWGLRISVLLSLSANVLLSLLSGTRQRSASGWRAVVLWFVTRIVLWMAYQGAEIAAAGALGSLSLCGSDASAEEQVVIAFWEPFLLLHLGGPDTMTAYALEDNTMSLRKLAEMVFHIWGAFYVLYKYIFRVRSWTLLATASVIMLHVGAARYVEKWYALSRSNSMKEDDRDKDDSSKKEEEEEEDEDEEEEEEEEEKEEEKELNDDEALRLAQDLFHVCRRALADSSVLPRSEKQRASNKIFRLEWKSMCKVVEMELSLMYEALYTKAIVLHTFPVAGYLIRLLSPLATAAAVLLFNQYIGSRRSQSRSQDIIRGSFVEITYLLLGFALAMDLVWLLRALGSTWTYAALKEARPWACWLRHHLLCRGRWRCLHLVVEYPAQWLCCRDHPHPAVSCRTWSRTIGRYNLLHECSAGAAHRRHRRPWWWRFCSWLKKTFDLEEMKYLRELPHDVNVKELLIKRVRLILASTNKPKPAGDDEDGYTMVHITTLWGQRALKEARQLFEGNPEPIRFGREFEEDVLVWHMATCVFLSRDKVKRIIPAGSSSAKVKAIEAMSEYLMFFVAVRRHMLPGLVLHSLFEKTLRALGKIWDKEKGNKTSTGSPSSSPKDRLANILLKRGIHRRKWFGRDRGRLLVFDASVLAGVLISTSKIHEQVPQLLEFIFNVWVDKLLYAAVRCSRESHAKQLSRGGDLTTILWMIIQHAGPFRIGEKRPRYMEPEEEKKAGEKKPAAYKEREEDKKKAELKKPEFKDDPTSGRPASPRQRHPGRRWWGIIREKKRMGADIPDDEPEEAKEADEDPEEYDMPRGYFTLY